MNETNIIIRWIGGIFVNLSYYITWTFKLTIRKAMSKEISNELNKQRPVDLSTYHTEMSK